jgi:hypothetical protein
MYEILVEQKRVIRKLRSTIERLCVENERLRIENSRLLGQAVVDADKLSKRTLALALAGALPKPGTSEAEALGYT